MTDKVIEFPGRTAAPVVSLVNRDAMASRLAPTHYDIFCRARQDMLTAWRRWVDTRREDLDPVLVLDELRATQTALENIVDLANTWTPPGAA